MIYPYQQAGAEWLAARRTAFLADEMGLGKTVQAIRGADIIGAKKILVICPAVARIQWAREFERWQTISRDVFPWVKNQSFSRITDHDVTICSHEALVNRLLARTLCRPWDLVVVDEAQAFKTNTAKRTIALYGRGSILAEGKRVWLLSGTPMPNHPGELWTHLHTLFGDSRPYHEFLNRYCIVVAGDYGPRIMGSRNVSELKERLRPHILRRRATEVLKDLPPITFGHVAIRVSSANAHAVDLLALQIGTLDPEALLANGSEHIAAIRRTIGELKAPIVAELILGELTADPKQKLVCFAWHLGVLDKIEEQCRVLGVVRIDGSTTPVARQKAIDSFQDNPETRLFLGQIKACSTAITLTAAHHVVLAEASWTPGDNVQAAKRCHRIGQTRPVLARFVTLDGTIDDAVNRVLARKARMLTELWDNQEES